jgi:hypothetical protein
MHSSFFAARKLALGFAAALLMPGLMQGAAQAAPAKPKPPVVSKTTYTIEAAMTEVIAALDRRDCAGALPGLKYLWDNAELAKTDAKLASQMRRQRVLCVSLADSPAAGLALSEANLKNPAADAEAYNVHLLLQLQVKALPEASKTLSQALNRFPDQTEALADEPVLGLVSALKSSDRTAFDEDLDRLTDAGWEATSARNKGYLNYLRLERLRDLSKAAGDPARIAAYREHIEGDGFFYMVMMSDTGLTPATAKPKPLSGVISDEIVEAKIALIKHPDDLATVDALTSLYAQTDQEQQSITLLSRYLGLVDENGLLAFANPESYQNLLVKKAGMLANQGRHDEALAVFTAGEPMVAGQENLDFYTGYMNYLTDMGREKESLALESKIDVKSLGEDDLRDLAAHKACAYAYLGDKTNYQAMMKTLPDHAMVRLKPLICARDEAGAVANIVAMLNDPEMRDDAAVLVQDTLAPKPWTPRDQAYVDMFIKVRQTPEVLKAASAAKVTIRKWDVRY